jgi:hypothetical protein
VVICPVGRVTLNKDGAMPMRGGTTPVPARRTVAVPSSGSLLWISSVPMTSQGTAGVKVTTSVRDSPGWRANVSVGATNACGVTVTPVMRNRSVPSFETFTLSRPEAPMKTCPKSMLARETAMSGTPVTCRRVGTSTAGRRGSLLSNRSAAR